MLRQIIKIDEEKCNGCGICAEACHEGAIAVLDNKAKLIREDYCDGLGNCLPVCPTGAISFETREAPEFDEEAALKDKKVKPEVKIQKTPCSCPGSQARTFNTVNKNTEKENEEVVSHLTQWPVQIKLVPINAPYFRGANLLIAADCTAFSYGGFHSRFMKGKVTLIGCPKLDMVDYSDKLTDILTYNDIKSITVVRMEVPCCGGIVHAVIEAMKNSGKMIPWQIVTISTDGNIIDN